LQKQKRSEPYGEEGTKPPGKKKEKAKNKKKETKEGERASQKGKSARKESRDVPGVRAAGREPARRGTLRSGLAVLG
jgi:hypothetical protein